MRTFKKLNVIKRLNDKKAIERHLELGYKEVKEPKKEEKKKKVTKGD